MKKVGHISEFLFGIYWWTWKTNYQKNSWSGTIKNKIILIFTLLHLFFQKKKKRKKRTCRYHYQNLDDVIYSSWDMEHKILKLVVLGHFLSFYSLKNPKNFEKWKNLLEISFYTSAPQMTITWCIVPEIWSVTKHKKIKFWKTEKITWRYYHFTIVYQKSWSYAILFLRYGVWQM